MGKFTKILVGLGMFFAWAFVVALFIAGFNSMQTNNGGAANTNQNANSLNSAEQSANALQKTQELVLSSDVVAKHNSENDCWMIIEGKVYDFTKYVNQHPAGAEYIIQNCGKDGSIGYETKDKQSKPKDHSSYARSLLSQYYLGDLNAKILVAADSQNTQPTLPTTNLQDANISSIPSLPTQTQNTQSAQSITSLLLTAQEVAKHNSENDCWMIIEGKVYDFTKYINLHPAGVQYIIMMCGKDGSSAYQTKDNQGKDHSSYARSLLSQYYLGELNQNVTQTSVEIKQAQIVNNTLIQSPIGSNEEEGDD